LTNIEAVATELLGEGGNSILSDNISVSLEIYGDILESSTDTLEAGGILDLKATVNLPPDQPEGIYKGSMTVTGHQDTESGDAVSCVIQVELSVDNTAPPAPVLLPISSPVDTPTITVLLRPLPIQSCASSWMVRKLPA